MKYKISPDNLQRRATNLILHLKDLSYSDNSGI